MTFCSALAALFVAAALTGTQARADEQAAPVLPDPDKAYLIVGARVLPAGAPQPKWIQVARLSGIRRAGYLSLPADAAIHALDPGRYGVRKLHFRNSSRSAKGVQRLGQLPEFELAAGRVYYYGSLEVDETGRDAVLNTRVDPELYSKACQQAPYILVDFEFEWLFPERAAANELPSCEPPPPAQAAAVDTLPEPAPEAPPVRLRSDPGKAYLVIGHKLLPEGARDVSWVRLENDDGEHYWVGADTTVRGLPPGSYRVFQVYHRERQAPGGTKHLVHTFPRIALEAGGLYYYGVLELDTRAEKHSLLRRYDPALFRRACGRLPEDMLAVPVEFPFDKEPGAVDCRGTAAFGTTP